MARFLALWNNVVEFSIPPRFRKKSYVELPEWLSREEVSSSMLVPSTYIMAYRWGMCFSGDDVVKRTIHVFMRLELMGLKVV